MKILIVDDHALFREGLCYVLKALDERVTIIEASDYDSALQHVSENTELDLVLLDLNMPGQNGFTTLDALSKHYPALPVVILSASNQRSDIQHSMDAGAMGFIPKETTSEVMLNALRLILSGGIYVPQSMVKQNEAVLNENGLGLTPRQLEVLVLLLHGDTNKEIASKIDIAEATVKMHVTAILRTLGVSNRTQAARAAEKMGLSITNN